MPGFVKTRADETLWAKAKRAAGHAEMKGKHYWAFANAWFHKQQKKKH